MSLTGKIRYRAKRRLFGKPLLVVQVEESNRVVDRFGNLERLSFWRDASVEDLTVVEELV